MKVIIYQTKWSSWFSVICSIVTGSGYSHGAIMNNGVLYDTTFKRGCLDVAQRIDNDRGVAVIDIDGDCEGWIKANLYTQYDWLGLVFWYFRIAISGKMYCFNVVENSLASLNIHLDLGWRKDGGSIVKRLLDKGCKVELMRGKEFHERFKCVTK